MEKIDHLDDLYPVTINSLRCFALNYKCQPHGKVTKVITIHPLGIMTAQKIHRIFSIVVVICELRASSLEARQILKSSLLACSLTAHYNIPKCEDESFKQQYLPDTKAQKQQEPFLKASTFKIHFYCCSTQLYKCDLRADSSCLQFRKKRMFELYRATTETLSEETDRKWRYKDLQFVTTWFLTLSERSIQIAV